MVRTALYFVMEVVQGIDYEATFAVLNPANNPPTPVDVTTGYTFSGKVAKEYFGSGAPLYEWSIDSPFQNVELGNGFVKIKVPSTDSRDWNFRRVFYDLEVTNNVTGSNILIAHGPLIVEPTIP